jgi:hypothetical protein
MRALRRVWQSEQYPPVHSVNESLHPSQGEAMILWVDKPRQESFF